MMTFKIAVNFRYTVAVHCHNDSRVATERFKDFSTTFKHPLSSSKTVFNHFQASKNVKFFVLFPGSVATLLKLPGPDTHCNHLRHNPAAVKL